MFDCDTPTFTELGESNLKSFIESGYNHISVNPCAGAMKILNKHGFINKGFRITGG